MATSRQATETPAAGQTSIYNVNAGGEINGGAASTKPGAASVTMGWTLSAAHEWAIGAVSIKPVSSGGGATATIAIDHTSTGVNASMTTNTFTVSHPTGSGTNRMMLVGISQEDSQVTGVTYGGVALTLVGKDETNWSYVDLYMLQNPPTGY